MLPEYLHDGFMSEERRNRATAALWNSAESITVRSTDFLGLALVLPDKDKDLVGKRLWEIIFCSTTLQPGALEARFKPFPLSVAAFVT